MLTGFRGKQKRRPRVKAVCEWLQIMLSEPKLDDTCGIRYLRFKLLNFFSSFNDRRSLIFNDLASTVEQMWLKSSGDKTHLRVSRKDS